jgi:putative transposase
VPPSGATEGVSSYAKHRRFTVTAPHVPGRTLTEEFSFILHLRTRGEEIAVKRHAQAKARRWVVERTHSWLNRFRAILIRWSKKPANYLGLLHLACGIISWRHALPG